METPCVHVEFCNGDITLKCQGAPVALLGNLACNLWGYFADGAGGSASVVFEETMRTWCEAHVTKRMRELLAEGRLKLVAGSWAYYGAGPDLRGQWMQNGDDGIETWVMRGNAVIRPTEGGR